MNGKISLVGNPEYERDWMIAMAERAIHDEVEALYNAVPQKMISKRQRLLVFNVGGLEAARVWSDLNNIHYAILSPEIRCTPENYPMPAARA